MARMGRPRKYITCMDLEAMCELYFEEIDRENEERENKKLKTKPYTITGLALFLGMDTDSLLDYQKRKDFSGIVKRYKALVSLDLQERSIMDHKQTTGCIFNLKCNHNMVETKHIELSGPDGGSIESKVEYVDPRDQGEKEDV